jgi:ubiquinone/menaquinone biosynthesis C-methylase UbiE
LLSEIFFLPANFNRIAPFYDTLAFLVFGRRLMEAKKAFFPLIPDQARILLLGGGTGNILNDLLNSKPAVTIDYVEPSQHMLDIAAKHLLSEFRARMNFICGDEHQVPQNANYDVCTSFFVLDCFTQSHARDFAQIVTSTLKPDGLWLFADFFPARNAFQQVLTVAMYGFFAMVSSLEARVIPDYAGVFDDCGFTAVHEMELMNGFIRSMVLKRK